MISLSFVVSTLLIHFGYTMAERLGADPARDVSIEALGGSIRGHVIVVGYSYVGRVICMVLERAMVPYLASPVKSWSLRRPVLLLDRREAQAARVGYQGTQRAGGSTPAQASEWNKHMTALPEPLSVPWQLRPVSSAQCGVETLADGRKRYWVKHEALKGVTSRMLAWWFAHFAEGEVEIEGRRLDRYRVWHPFDHVYARYVRRAPDGSGGPGAQIALCEYLARNPRYKIEVVSTVEKVDETGFIHKVMRGGIQLVRMEHVFTETSIGTRDENCLIVPGGPLLAPLSRFLLPRLMPADKGQAWLKHSVEEVGTLEHFLPQLYAREAEGRADPTGGQGEQRASGSDNARPCVPSA